MNTLASVVALLVVASSLAGVGVVAQSDSALAQDRPELPDSISIETVAGEDASQTNEVPLGESFEVVVGVDTADLDDQFAWKVTVDGQEVAAESATDATIDVRLRSEDLSEGDRHDLEVALTFRGDAVRASTAIRIGDSGTRDRPTLPDNVTIESVNGEDADQVNDLRHYEEFEIVLGGVDAEELDERYGWVVTIDGREVARETGTNTTITGWLDPEDVPEGENRELEVVLNRDESVRATTTVNVVSDPDRDRSGYSDVMSLADLPSGIPPAAEPTQQIRLDGRFTDADTDSVTLTFEMYGPARLPEDLEVTAVSAESDVWSVDARPVEEGIEVDVRRGDGPSEGEIRIAIEFDATEVYDEDEEVERIETIKYEISDADGDYVGTMGTFLWARPFHVVVETPDGERVTPKTDRENWEEYYIETRPPFDPVNRVFVDDGRLVMSRTTVPDADGLWTNVYHPGLYLRADVEGYADPAVPMDEIDPEAHMWPENPYVLELPEGGDVRVELTDQHGQPLPDGWLELEDEAGVKYQLRADDDGVVRGKLPEGEYSGAAAAHTALPEWDVDLTVAEGEQTEEAISLTAPEVVSASVEHVGGTEPDVDAIEVDSIFYEGAMIVALKPESTDPITREQVDQFGVDKDPHDLSELGVDETTELRITLEFDGFDPDSLLWAARDARWEIVESGDDRTVVQIETKATEIQKLDAMRTGFGSADTVEWPTGDGDVADEEYGAVVEVWLWDLDAVSVAESYINGMSVTTNAQLFGMPEVENGTLSVYMAAPSETVDGESHSGFYQAFIPDELLEEWDVEDPETDLEVMWAGEPEQFHVEEVDGGVYIEVEPIHYSDGTMEVRSLTYEPDDSVFAEFQEFVPWVAGVGLLILLGIGGAVLLRRR